MCDRSSDVEADQHEPLMLLMLVFTKLPTGQFSNESENGTEYPTDASREFAPRQHNIKSATPTHLIFLIAILSRNVRRSVNVG